MYPYPHTYRVTAQGTPTHIVKIAARDLPDIDTTSPPEFGGPAGYWSPETLLCAAVADCFILTFRGIARAARFNWLTLECHVSGTLQRSEGVSQFTQYVTQAKLGVQSPADVDRARSLLEQTENACLVANSLRGTRILEIQIVTPLDVPTSVPAGAHTSSTAA